MRSRKPGAVSNKLVMAGLVPAIHVFTPLQFVDAQRKAGHETMEGPRV
jgi:hypothetical protein